MKTKLTAARETTELRWFEQFPRCSCGKVANGILRGRHNESYGYYCTRCAERRLAASAKARAALSSSQPQGQEP